MRKVLPIRPYGQYGFSRLECTPKTPFSIASLTLFDVLDRLHLGFEPIYWQ